MTASEERSRPVNDHFRDMLETFDNQYPEPGLHDRDRLPRVHVGLPEDGPARLRHADVHATCPTAKCVELKSLKFYLQQFRNEGIFYENVTNRILDDLVAVLQPRRLTLAAAFTPAGRNHDHGYGELSSDRRAQQSKRMSVRNR